MLYKLPSLKQFKNKVNLRTHTNHLLFGMISDPFVSIASGTATADDKKSLLAHDLSRMSTRHLVLIGETSSIGHALELKMMLL